MSAARKVSRLAVGDPALRAVLYPVPRTLVQEGRTDEELPLGTRGGVAIPHYFPMDGEYVFRIRMARNRIDEIRGLLHAYRIDALLDGRRIQSFHVGGEEIEKGREGLEANYTALANYLTHADDEMEFRATVTAGRHVVGVTFPEQSSVIEGPPEKAVQPKSWDYYHAKLGLAGIGRVEIRGPYDATGPGDTPSRRRIFTCRPEAGEAPDRELRCARQIVSRLARRAFRRPVTEADLETLIGFYELGRADGGFEAGIELALQRILVSPYFLFRVERDPAGIAPDTPYRISDIELASRLSFFLWSSIPDEQLLAAAAEGRLRDPAVLDREVRRMLADPRADALVGNFAAQWLGTRNLSFAVPNEDLFPRVRREPAAGVPARDRAVRGEHPARRPQRVRPAHGRPHLRERAAGQPLRHPGRAGQLVPPRDAGTGPRRARRHPRPRQRADGHVAGDAHLAGQPRQVDPGESARHAAAAAAARGAGPRGRGRRGPGAVDARGDGGAPPQPGLRRLPRQDGPARAVAGELRRRRRVA